ncbi:MAG TPA: rhomboid family intramembrane serine protease [Caulobacteraceae bacterium]|nr:rhomboid family intramembrane serine protease [Caulobacteraceae bacterium]
MRETNEINEPPLKGPWPAWALAAVILGSYLVQTLCFASVDQAAGAFGLAVSDLGRGRTFTLVTCLFVHGGWAHAGMNAAGALAFGAPVARLLGKGVKGAASFALFYIVCGVLAGLGYAAVSPHSQAVLIGASGAVSGLFGAASRLMEHRPRLSPFASRFVVGSAAAWLVVNLAMGLSGLAPGLGVTPIAWQAHLFGYAAGLLLIGPWSHLLGPRQPSRDQAPEELI